MKRKGVLCFLKKENQVLLIKVDYGTEGVLWNGVSGFIDEGEQAEEAVCREVKEELGIEVNIDSLKHVGHHTVSNKLELDVFIASEWSGEPSPQEESIKNVRWFEVDNLPFEAMFSGNEEWLSEFIN